MYGEICDNFIDISDLKSIKSVVADCYTSYAYIDGTGPHLPRSEWKVERSGQHITDIKNEVFDLVNLELKGIGDINWIWSCDYTVMGGFHFGLERPGGRGGIYSAGHNKLDLSNNEFIQLQYDESKIKTVEEKLGFSLNEDYILCQTGYRKGYNLSKVRINHDKVISKLLKSSKVVLMNFKTNRLNDSYSNFEVNDKYSTINVSDLKEQSVLIHYANRCVFFTEGHLRSHTYLPPMFGRNVEVVAGKDIFTFTEAPLDFWNENVFKFGGQMNAVPYEDITYD
tara:strand:- start:86 stop:931 length:846 start_codon:yes stop_codon:yes gene_type:complete